MRINSKNMLPTFWAMSALILTAASCASSPSGSEKALHPTVGKVEPPVSLKVVRESKERNDLLDEESPKGLRVEQITTNPNADSKNE